MKPRAGKRRYRHKDQPFCILIQGDGWLYVATMADLWNDRRNETRVSGEHADYEDGADDER